MRTSAKVFGVLTGLIASLGAVGRSEAAPRSGFEAGTKNLVAGFEPKVARRGQTITFRLSFDVEPRYHTYPLTQVDPEADGYATEIRFVDPSATATIVPVGEFKEAPFEEVPNTDAKAKNATIRHVVGHAFWERQVVVRPDAVLGTKTIKVKLTVQVCIAGTCFPGPKFIDLPLTISDEPAVTVEPNYADVVAKAMTLPTAPPAGPIPPKVATPSTTPKPEARPPIVAPSENSEEHAARLKAISSQLEVTNVPKPASDLLTFILSGIFWGAVSLVTPCVFPMIPITVSFFLHQSGKDGHRPITMALVYCATIVVVLTLAAVCLLSFFTWLSVNSITNFILGGVFVFFALSLFGMYEIELPSFMTRYTSAREGKGGLAGTVFMALTFTIISFACVAPFLGGFGGTAASSTITWAQRVFGGLAFSVTFASPFFFLALFPTLLKKLPKSGSWLNGVKVVMGFLELAAALKFLRAGEVNQPTPPAFFTFDLVLGLYVALSALCGLYLLGVYRLPHDTPNDHLGVFRMILSGLFLGLAIYLMPALFKTADGERQQPSGTLYAWISSFLLPEGGSGLEWEGDLAQAVAEARQLRKETGKPQLIFVDFTGKTCTNCKFNEGSVFTRGDVKERLKKYKRVQMYTDRVPLDLYPPELRDQVERDPERTRDDATANGSFQWKNFADTRLPMYVILDPQADTIKVVGVYKEGKINDVAAFNNFLGKPLEKKDAAAQARAD